jgi:isocitrate dehydrogenase
MDGIQELQDFADRLEKATLDTINSGIMTKDLALLYEGEARSVTSREFLTEIAKRIPEA